MSQDTAATADPGFVRAILNLVIPPEGGMPGAGDLGLWPSVAASLGQNPAVFAAFTAALDAVRRAALERDPGGLAALSPAAAAEVVRSSLAAHPEVMPALFRLAAMAYYQQPAVLVALCEPARPPFPEGFELEPISPQWLAILEQRAQRR